MALVPPDRVGRRDGSGQNQLPRLAEARRAKRGTDGRAGGNPVIDHDRRPAGNPDRLAALIDAIRDWNLFLAFLIVDGCTEGKDRGSLHWFFGEVAGKVTAEISACDILE